MVDLNSKAVSRGCRGCAGALAGPTLRRFNGHRALRLCMQGCQWHISAAPLGLACWPQSLCPRTRPPPKSQRVQLRGLGHVHTSTPQKQTNGSFNSDCFMRSIMHLHYYECIHVSHLCGAHNVIYYSNSILKDDFLYPIAKTCGVQFYSSCVSHLDLLLPLSSLFSMAKQNGNGG